MLFLPPSTPFGSGCRWQCVNPWFELLSHRYFLLSHLDCLGLRVNFAKSALSPSQQILFLGTVLDSTLMRAVVMPEHALAIQQLAASFKIVALCPLKAFQKMLRLMASTSPVDQACKAALAPWRDHQWMERGCTPGHCLQKERSLDRCFQLKPEGAPHLSPFGQLDSSVLHESPGQSLLEVPLYSGGAPLGMGLAQFAFTESDTCAGQVEPGSRHEDNSHCPTYFSKNKDALAHEWPNLLLYAFPPVTLIPQVIRRVRDQKHKVLLVAPFWRNQHWFAQLCQLLSAALWPIPLRRDPLSQANRTIWHPQPEILALHLNTISQARAPSTRHLYTELLEKGRSPSTLKAYGSWRLNPPRPITIPSWELPTVLRALRIPPFEPLQSIDLCPLMLKTTLLLALASVKHMGDLQVLLVNSTCLEFGPNDSKVVLKPRQVYVPKVLLTPFRAQVITLLALLPIEQDQDFNLLCPVRALRTYIEPSASFRQSEQLFVCFGGHTKGLPVTKQRLFKWIVEAIVLAYSSLGLQCPIGVKAHLIRGVASSWAWSCGVSIAEICAAAGWASLSTYARFYSLDVPALQALCISWTYSYKSSTPFLYALGPQHDNSVITSVEVT
ncbi:Protein P [Labeo rohita]|uniref:Protein P n=1 Tax=Labeo rohita TaxID=84645 RepID=A0ABQ8M3Y8_LABRO|nr:Protein P [Labeo rohita]